MERLCENCSVCCFISEVKFNNHTKQAYDKCKYLDENSKCPCTIYNNDLRPKICSAFKCSWLRGFGNENDRPDKNGILVSINNMNGGNWVFVIENKKNAIRTTGKEMIINMTNKIDLPIIISAYGSVPPNDTGDYVIIKNSLIQRSSLIMGKFIEYLDKDIGLYTLNK